ncbi:hypothetical protein [Niallia sp. 03190]|uniref:hypothetical protein n=1 Tax=Niallia sp. 03190 TaxID=3458061 RepID=UPI004045037B
MDIYYTGDKISMGDFITLFEDEMKKLNYCHGTIHDRILMIKRAYSGSSRLIDEAEHQSVIRKNSINLLTNLEFRLLYSLIKFNGKGVSVNALMEKLELISPSSLYVCVKKIT